jgi:hypothetical protein
MKKILIAVFVTSTLFALTAFIWLRGWEYSLNNINADNYEEKLKGKKDVPIWTINGCTPDDIDFSQMKNVNFSNEYFDGLKISISKPTDQTSIVSALNESTNLIYDLSINENKQCIFVSIHHFPIEPDPSLKEICNQLIVKRGFILKKAEKKGNYDVLVQEIDDRFTVVEIVGNYNEFGNSSPPLDLIFKSYAKQKF